MSESSQALIGQQNLIAQAAFRGIDIDHDSGWHHKLEEPEASKKDGRIEVY